MQTGAPLLSPTQEPGENAPGFLKAPWSSVVKPLLILGSDSWKIILQFP